MMMEPNYNIVVIGMGNIGKFLMPGYRLLLGDKVETNVFGVRNNPDKVSELQKQVPFQVSAGNALELLQEKKPDTVLMKFFGKSSDLSADIRTKSQSTADDENDHQ